MVIVKFGFYFIILDEVYWMDFLEFDIFFNIDIYIYLLINLVFLLCIIKLNYVFIYCLFMNGEYWLIVVGVRIKE